MPGGQSLLEPQRGERATGCVYCFRVGPEDTCRVGRTKNPPVQRLKSVSVGSPQKLTLHREIKTDDAAFLEKYIHRLLDIHRAQNGEFSTSPRRNGIAQ